MKNLKINKERISALAGAIILVTNLTGCSPTSKTNTESMKTYVSEDSIISNNGNIKYLVVKDNNKEKLVPIENLRLADKDNKIIERLDGVIVDNKIMNIQNPVEVIFNNEIEKVLIGYEIVSTSELKLVDYASNKEITNIVGMYDNNNEFVEYDKKTNNNTADDNKDEEEYIELTDEKFYELADKVYNKYKEIGLDVKEEEVIDFLMMVNIDKISKDNKDLVEKIIGDRNRDTVILNMMDVYSAIKTKNDNNYCAKRLGFDSIILVNDTIFDKETRDKTIEFESRIEEIFNAKNDKEKFNELLNKLMMEVLTATEEEFNMENGAGYSIMEILMYFIRSNFTNIMNKENAELIKYFCNYIEEYGTTYYENSRSTAYYSGMYYLFTDSYNCGKTRTK